MNGKTHKFRGTWHDRPGELVTHYIKGGRHGVRVTVLKFDDADLYEVRLIKGDGRNPSQFKLYNCSKVSEAQVEPTVAAMIKQAEEI